MKVSSSADGQTDTKPVHGFIRREFPDGSVFLEEHQVSIQISQYAVIIVVII